MPEHYSAPLRKVVASMLCKDVRARPEANQLLTEPSVVPHVQVGAGPGRAGWWRLVRRRVARSRECAAWRSGSGSGGGMS